MTKPKGRIIRGSEIRTGDTLMQPTVRSNSVVTSARTNATGILATLANGSTVEIPGIAKVRVYRPAKIVNHDATEIVFTSATGA